MNMKTTTKLLLTAIAFIAILSPRLASAGTLTWNGGGGGITWTLAGNWGGTAPVANDSLVFAGSTRLGPNNNYAIGTQFNGLTFAAGAGAFTLAGNSVNLGGNITNSSSNVQTLNGLSLVLLQNTVVDTGSAGMQFTTMSVNGSGFSLTKTGTGELNLNMNSSPSYAGLILNQGSVNVSGNNSGNLGTSTGTLTMADGTKYTNSYFAGSTATIAGVTNIANGATVTFETLNPGMVASTATLTGNGTYGNGVTVVIAGPGTVKLNSTTNATFGSTTGNTFRVDAGTLQIASDANLGSTNNNVVLNGGTLYASTAASFTLNAARKITLNSVAGNGIKVISGYTLTSSTTNQLTGSGGFSKTGDGILTISAAQNYSGTTTLSLGTLIAGNAAAFGTNTSASALTLNGGTLALYLNTSINAYNTTVGGNATIENDRFSAGAGIVTTLGTLSIGANTLNIITPTHNVTVDTAFGVTFGATTLTGNATFDVAKNGTADGTLTLGATSGGFGITKTNVGTLALASANTFTGTTRVSGGTLELKNNQALQNSTLDTSGAGVVKLTSVTTPTIGGLTGSTDLASVITTGYGSVTSLTLNPGVGVSNIYSGVIANGAAAMALNKTGLGSQTLSGANSYSGTTSVSAGTLLLNVAGTLANTSGATVSGTGILKLGASNAINSTATLTMAGGTFDAQTFTNTLGVLTVSANSAFDLGSGAAISFANSSSATWSNTLTLTGFVSGSTLRFGTDGTGLNVGQLLEFSATGVTAFGLDSNGWLIAVPEPATWALLAFGLTAVVIFRRRRDRSNC